MQSINIYNGSSIKLINPSKIIRFYIINLAGLVINCNWYVGIAAFEMAYDLWVAEQQKKDNELKDVLQSHVSELELRIFVDSGLNHYYELFQLKANAAKADVFYTMNGLWRTPLERFFQWLGGPRPSELLYVRPC